MTSGTVGGFRGFVERDRPFFDDQPDRNYGWESKSRWGSRPVREFGRAYANGVARVTGYSSGAWTRLKTAFRLLLVGSCLACLGSFAATRTVPKATGHIEQFRLGFALGPEGGVSPGCAASTFSLNDPIHLSMEVTGATVGSVVRVSVRDVVTKRITWSEARPVTPGRSLLTFEIGRALAVGRYRAESTFDGAAAAAKPWAFEVHDRRPDVRAGVGHRAVLPPGASVQVTGRIKEK